MKEWTSESDHRRLWNPAGEDAAAGRAHKQLIAADSQSRHKGIEQARINLLPGLPIVLSDEHAIDAAHIGLPPARRKGVDAQVHRQSVVNLRPILPAVTRDRDAAARCSGIQRAAFDA